MRQNRNLTIQVLIFLSVFLIILITPMDKLTEIKVFQILVAFHLTFFCILYIHKKIKIFTESLKNKKKNTHSYNNSDTINDFYRQFIFEDRKKAEQAYREHQQKKREKNNNVHLYLSETDLEIQKAISFLDIQKSFHQLTIDEIKRAYRKKALKIHPDLNNNSDDSKIKMQELNKNYEFLLNLKANKK